jgi:hypothetical protein
VLTFHVWHSELEHNCAAVGTLRYRHPRGARVLAFEGLAELE